MRTIKKKPTRFLYRWLFWICLASIGIGCDKKEDKKEVPLTEFEARLVGMWKVVSTPEYSSSNVIRFNPDHTIEYYVPLVGDTYRVTVPTEIVFIQKETLKEYVYDFTFNEDGTITIYNFVDNSATSYVKNVTFKKMK